LRVRPGAYPNWATGVGSGKTNLKNFARDKRHSSLFRLPIRDEEKKQHNVDTKSFEKLSFVFWMKFPGVVVVVVAARRSTTSREDKKLEEQHRDPHGRQAFISQDHSSIFFLLLPDPPNRSSHFYIFDSGRLKPK
jgi:hypothetical protein